MSAPDLRPRVTMPSVFMLYLLLCHFPRYGNQSADAIRQLKTVPSSMSTGIVGFKASP